MHVCHSASINIDRIASGEPEKDLRILPQRFVDIALWYQKYSSTESPGGFSYSEVLFCQEGHSVPLLSRCGYCVCNGSHAVEYFSLS